MEVLIIDDEASIRESIYVILSDENIRSKTAKSLQEAKTVLEKEFFPIVILDMWLEDGYGLDFIDTIKEISPSSYIVIISGHLDRESIVQLQEKGVFDIIEKPLSIERLLGIINEILRN